MYTFVPADAFGDTTTIASIIPSSSGGSDGKLHTSGHADAPAYDMVEDAWAASLVDVNTTAAATSGGEGTHAPSEGRPSYCH